MPYRIAGIDVHKKMLAVVVTDVEVEEEYQFERRRFGSTPEHLRLLCAWLLERGVEEAEIKLSSLVSDLLGVSARRMLQAIAAGERQPEVLAAMADRRLKATPEQLCDVLGACRELNPVYRHLVQMALEELSLLEQQMGQMDQEMAGLLRQHQDAVQRLAEVPGLGVDSAQQNIAE